MTGLNHVSKHIMYPREINLDPVTIVLLIVEYTANVPTAQNTVFFAASQSHYTSDALLTFSCCSAKSVELSSAAV